MSGKESFIIHETEEARRCDNEVKFMMAGGVNQSSFFNELGDKGGSPIRLTTAFTFDKPASSSLMSRS
jgi:hypothetical protein